MTRRNLILAICSFLTGYVFPFCIMALSNWLNSLDPKYAELDTKIDWEHFWNLAPQVGWILGTVLFFAVLRIKSIPKEARLSFIPKLLLLSIPPIFVRQVWDSQGKVESLWSLEFQMAFQIFLIAVTFFLLEDLQSEHAKQTVAKNRSDEVD